MTTRRIEILSFLEGALAAFTYSFGDEVGFEKALELVINTYSKRPMFRSELKEVLDEFKPNNNGN